MLSELIRRVSLFRVRGGKYSEQAEEIADQVFFALWWNDCHILRGFKTDKGTLRTYLTGVVKHFAQQETRRAQIERSRMHQYAAQRPVPSMAGHEEIFRMTLEEFSTRLSGELKRYFQQQHLGILQKGKAKKYSKANAWKLEQRLREEWERFFSEM